MAWLQVVADGFNAVHADRKATVAAPTAAGPDRAAAALAHTTEAVAHEEDPVHSTARFADVAGNPHVHDTVAVAGAAFPVPDFVVVADAAGHVHHATTAETVGSLDNTAADAARLMDATVTVDDAAASALPKRLHICVYICVYMYIYVCVYICIYLSIYLFQRCPSALIPSDGHR